MHPTQSDLHVNVPLTNMSVAYMQENTNFIANRVFPAIPVQAQTGLFWKYNRADWNRTEVKLRAPSTETAGVGYSVTTDTYFTQPYGLHRDIDDQLRANADSNFSLDREAIDFLAQQFLQKWELDWFATFMANSVWANERTGVAGTPSTNEFKQFNDAASDPVETFRKYMTEFQLASGGYRPNVCVMSRQVFDVLLDHPDIIDRIKYGQTPGAAAAANAQILASLLGIERLEVSDAIKNTADEKATEVLAWHAGKSILLAYAPARPSLRTPSAAYNFVWSGYTGVSTLGTRVLKFRLDAIRSDRIELESSWAYKVIGTDLGLLMKTVIA